MLVAIAIFAAYFPLARFYHSRFTTPYGQYYVESVLGFEIHDGDAVGDVALHFASHKLLGNDDKLDMQSAKYICLSRNFQIKNGDQFYTFSAHNRSGAFLQFRNGRLINLQNADYSDAPTLAQLNRNILPNDIFLVGAYAVFVSCLLLLCQFLYNRQRTTIERKPMDNANVPPQIQCNRKR